MNIHRTIDCIINNIVIIPTMLIRLRIYCIIAIAPSVSVLIRTWSYCMAIIIVLIMSEHALLLLCRLRLSVISDEFSTLPI